MKVRAKIQGIPITDAEGEDIVTKMARMERRMFQLATILTMHMNRQDESLYITIKRFLKRRVW